MKESASAPTAKSSKLNFSLKSDNASYDFTLMNKDDVLTLKFEDLKEFPVKIYELKIGFEKLKQLDDNFFMFKTVEKLINAIKNCINNDNYSVVLDKDESSIIFEIKNEIFENGGARIKIPEKKQDLESQVESLTKIVAEMKKEIQNIKIIETEKDESAVNSYIGTWFLKDEEKKQISKWIHHTKIIKFNLLFSTDKDGDSSSTFHYYCDGIFPTVTVVVDTSGRKFGGYTTHNWIQSPVGANYTKAPDSFIFNLSNNKKFELINQFNNNAIYKHTSYGPGFGDGHDLIIASNCRSNTSSYCAKGAYNTGNNNLLDGNGTTSFQVSNYEVYQVIFE